MQEKTLKIENVRKMIRDQKYAKPNRHSIIRLHVRPMIR